MLRSGHWDAVLVDHSIGAERAPRAARMAQCAPHRSHHAGERHRLPRSRTQALPAIW
jgi:hypothetical protein